MRTTASNASNASVRRSALLAGCGALLYSTLAVAAPSPARPQTAEPSKPDTKVDEAARTPATTPVMDERAPNLGTPLTLADGPVKIKPPEWAIIATPLVGKLGNTTTFRVSVPSQDGFAERVLTVAGSGWGGGLLVTGFYKRLTFTNVLYNFPEVNDTNMLGNITLASYSMPTGTFAEPFFGMGFAYISTDSALNDFTYSLNDELSDGTPTIGYAHFDEFAINTKNYQVLPEIGVKLKIPIHSWYIRPYYQYLYQRLSARARTDSGNVDVYRNTDGSRAFEIPLRFDSENVTENQASVVGTGFGIDFYSFLRLQGAVYHNIDYSLTSARLIGSVLFNRYVGLSAYFEHQDMITVDNTYFMIGVSFLKFPTEFFDQVEALRDRKKNLTASN